MAAWWIVQGKPNPGTAGAGGRPFPKGVSSGRPFVKGMPDAHTPESRARLTEQLRAKTPEHNAKVSAALRGKTKSEEHKRKLSESLRRLYADPTKHPNWKGGYRRAKYPKIFRESLKLKIRTRDNFACCLCGRTEDEERAEFGKALCVNHIDFDKENCAEGNLNTLCLRCNLKINGKRRSYWTDYFQWQMKERQSAELVSS